MPKQLDSEMELYGVSPYAITILIVLVTLALPIGGIISLPYGLNNGFYLIYSALWIVFPSEGLRGLWRMMNPAFWASAIWVTIPLCILNILFIRQIWRYYMGYSAKSSVQMVGMLSLIAPSLISLYITYAGFSIGMIVPIPIQYVCGLVFLHKFREPELISPWSGIHLDLSWWGISFPTEPDTDTGLPSFSKRLIDHEADWLEGW